MRRSLACTWLVVLASCFASRPPFVEPRWGNAPPPLPFEITEITREHRRCTTNCTYERIAFRRDGRASREYVTGKRRDSLFVARIDSAAFAHLATSILQAGFFSAPEDDGHQEPLASESYVVSAATLCRRRALTIGQAWIQSGHYLTVRVAIDSTVRALGWEPCCRIDW